MAGNTERKWNSRLFGRRLDLQIASDSQKLMKTKSMTEIVENKHKEVVQ